MEIINGTRDTLHKIDPKRQKFADFLARRNGILADDIEAHIREECRRCLTLIRNLQNECDQLTREIHGYENAGIPDNLRERIERLGSRTTEMHELVGEASLRLSRFLDHLYLSLNRIIQACTAGISTCQQATKAIANSMDNRNGNVSAIDLKKWTDGCAKTLQNLAMFNRSIHDYNIREEQMEEVGNLLHRIENNYYPEWFNEFQQKAGGGGVSELVVEFGGRLTNYQEELSNIVIDIGTFAQFYQL